MTRWQDARPLTHSTHPKGAHSPRTGDTDMTHKFTHTATITGRSLAQGGTWSLRQTPKFWVSEHGFKFRKADGTEAGVTWPVFTLHLDTLKANA